MPDSSYEAEQVIALALTEAQRHSSILGAPHLFIAPT